MGNTQYSKATKETAENLRIIDDAMFRLVAERKEACQEILRTLLDRPQLRVLKVTPQCVITSLHREIVLDVLCILEDGAYINIEMQKGSGNDDIKRNRFYAASTTAAYTPKGTDFSDIPQVVILYITEYDALHNGQMITRVKRCMDTQEGYVLVDDGEEIFFCKYRSLNFHIFPFDESVYSAIIFLCISDDIVCERVGNNHFLSLFYGY